MSRKILFILQDAEDKHITGVFKDIKNADHYANIVLNTQQYLIQAETDLDLLEEQPKEQQKNKEKNVHIFECFESIHKYAIQEFNSMRSALEEMHEGKIKVIKMYWCFGWKVKYEVL